MRIDERQRSWALTTLLLLMVAVVVYVGPYRAARAQTSSPGASWIGLGYGVAGTLCILFAGGLGLRKKLPLWRVGSLTTWMRGHFWLGLLSLFLILFHGAGAFGGALTFVMMVLLIGAFASGIVGAAFQHFMPQLMSGLLEDETPYDQIGRAFTELRVEAYRVVAASCGAVEEAALEQEQAKELGVRIAAGPPKDLAESDWTALARYYREQVMPFLRRPSHRRRVMLATELTATVSFENVRKQIGPALHEALDDLSRICSDARRLAWQSSLHHWLHLWLLVHVAAAMGLIVLIPVHVIMALYY